VDAPAQTRSSLRTLLGGETLLAGAGLGAALVMLAAVGAAGWWTLDGAAREARQSRENVLRATAQVMGPTAEHLIARNELGQLRTMVAGAAASHGYASVRVVIPGPKPVVVADSPVDESTYDPLPETWPAAAGLPQEVSVAPDARGRNKLTAPLSVPGRGPVVLEIEDNPAPAALGDWRTQAGVGAIGGGGLAALGILYRSLRARLRVLGAIRAALAAARAGETDAGALSVSAAMGPEAQAWNEILAERERLRRLAVREKAELQLGNRRGGQGGDLFGVCDAMWQGLVLVDDQLRVKFVNGAAAVFLRVKREEAAGQPIDALLPDAKALEALRGVVSGAARGRTVVEVERAGEGGPGARAASVLRLSVRPVRKEDHAAAVLVIEDVTQQRVADESRNAFVASATHELRTPLTNIRLYVDSLLEDPGQDAAKRSQALNVISTEARRLERMVGDMLSVSQIEAGTLKLNRGDVRLEPIFEELRHDFAEQARQKEITLKFDLPPKWPLMEGDRDKIVMALHNLVGNAIKYTPSGGEVTVRASADGKSFTVDVADNGIGIKEEEQPLVFEKFYRAKDRRIANVTGTGLGLAIAREVVRLHGGDITLQSAIDKGSTFTMTLPAKAA
jgi:signal transduction histidine kinase